ncbi:MAG: hypothetical protein GWP61_21570 [Chloroflexi bacterium]|nr:hypothetical protein [Chloroflexota bacterium]
MRYFIDTVSDLEVWGIGYRCSQESIDTTTSDGRLIFHIFGVVDILRRQVPSCATV